MTYKNILGSILYKYEKCEFTQIFNNRMANFISMYTGFNERFLEYYISMYIQINKRFMRSRILDDSKG